MNWILASILMFLSSVALYLFTRKAQLSKISIATYSLFTFAIPALMCLFVVFIKRESLIVPIPIFIALILTGFLLSYLGNFFSQRGILHAPNPGYINAVNAASISVITIFSAILFNDDLNIRKVIGVIGVTIGLFFIFL